MLRAGRANFERSAASVAARRSKNVGAGAGAAVVLVALLAVVGPAAAGGSGSAQSLMVPAPPGFQPFTGESSYNGPIDRAMFEKLTSTGAVADIPKDKLDKLLAGSWARTLKHEANGTVFIAFGYRLPDDDDAVSFISSAISSSSTSSQLRRVGGGDGHAVFELTTPSENDSRMSFLRQGRYVFQFIVVAPSGHADRELATMLAPQQLDLLPAGSRSLEPAEKSTASRTFRVLPIVVLLLVIAAFVARSNRKRKQEEAAVADVAGFDPDA